MENELRDVVGYEVYFSVTRDGRVWSKRTKKFLKTTLSKRGQYVVFVTRFEGRNGKAKLFRVHRLVAECYVSNPENKPFVNHLDGNKQNNHYSNLEWCTSKENSVHAYANGLNSGIKGDANISAKITDSDARKILELYVPKKFGYRRIAKLLGLPVNSVRNVTCPSRKAWSHIHEEFANKQG